MSKYSLQERDSNVSSIRQSKDSAVEITSNQPSLNQKRNKKPLLDAIGKSKATDDDLDRSS